MLARFLLTLVMFTSLVVSEQRLLTSVTSANQYTFKVIDYSTSRGGAERVSPIYRGPMTVRTPIIYRNTTWSKPLDAAGKAAVKAAAPFPWRDSADSSSSYMDYPMPSHMQGYWAFSTNWHFLSGYLSSPSNPEEFVTVIVPVSLGNGGVWGLMEFIHVENGRE